MGLAGGLALADTAPAGSDSSGSVVTLPNPLCLDPDKHPENCVQDFPALIKKITAYVSGVIGILATLMFVIAGILFVTSAGNPGRIETAKKCAIYAGVGLGIALAGAGLIAVITAVVGA